VWITSGVLGSPSMSRWPRTLDPADLPTRVLERMGKAPPKGFPVVRHSIPVVAFGNPSTSRVATCGINPSRAEFLSKNDTLLEGGGQRFETVPSLAPGGLADADPTAIASAVESCYRYFEHRPYWRWFGKLETLLAALDASYIAGTACHLDLVQWATDPVWRGLGGKEKQIALDADKQFLLRQLQEEPVQILLLNGRTVVDTYVATVGSLAELDEPVAVDGVSTVIFKGETKGVIVVGWSANLQSSRGLTGAFRQALSARVRQEAS
jgi:hypothetical protein